MKQTNLRKQLYLSSVATILLCLGIILACHYWLSSEFYGLLLGVGLAGALALVLSYFFSRKFTQPLGEIIAEAQAMSQGDFSRKVWLDSPEELSQLAQALNLMGSQLEKNIHKLTQERNAREAILASMVEGVLAIDQEERILTVNQAARRMLNLAEGELTGKPLAEVVRTSALQVFLRQVLNSQETKRAEFTLSNPRECFLDVNGAPLQNSQGDKIGALAVLNDVSILQRLNEVRKKFVADVSHELKTPITTIQGFVETLHDGALEDTRQAKHFLEIIARHTQRLNAIVEDLLALSRLEAEEQIVSLYPVQLIPVIEKSLANYQAAAREKELEMVFRPPDKAIQLMSSEELLERALNNLLDNAIKYSPNKGEIEVACQIENNLLTISVRDYGIGIPEKDLAHLFKRFYRVDKARSRQMGGTGLGLAIVKHIALTHNGRVEVSSKLNQGSVFSLHLPLKGR